MYSATKSMLPPFLQIEEQKQHKIYPDHRPEYAHLRICKIICRDIGVIIIEPEERKCEDNRSAECKNHDRSKILPEPAFYSNHFQ